MKKYLLCPGYVTSRTDGDQHYITAEQLARLYRVNPSECEVLTKAEVRRETVTMTEARRRRQAGLIKLGPRDDGDYRLPTA